METIDRQTATGHASELRPSLHRTPRSAGRLSAEALGERVQALWCATPRVAPDEREQLLVQLVQLGSDIERLQIRCVIDDSCDRLAAEMSECSPRLLDSMLRRSALAL